MNKKSILILSVIALVLISFCLAAAQKSQVAPGQQATPIPADKIMPITPPVGEKDECWLYYTNWSVASYFGGWYPGDKVAIYFDPMDCGNPENYPFQLTDVEFMLYDFAGVGTIDVRFSVEIAYADSCLGPGPEIYLSPVYTITTFYPNIVHIDFPLDSAICLYEPFFFNLQYMSGDAGLIPSVLMDDQVVDTCFQWFWYDGYSPPWWEHYDFWAPPVPGWVLLGISGLCGPEQTDCEVPEYMYLHAEDGLFQSLNFHLENLHLHSLQGLIDLIAPESTLWHELYPHYCQVYHLGYWEDNGDGILSPCDMIEIEQIEPPGELHAYHVKEVTLTLILSSEEPPFDTMALEFTGGYDLTILNQPVCTWWHEVWPTFCNWFHISNWYDQGTGYLDECDYLELTDTEGYVTYWHVEDIATDILLKRESFDPLGSQWHQIWPYYCQKYQLTFWEDNGDGILSPSDQLEMDLKDEEGNPTGEISWYHIDEVTTTMLVVEKTWTEQWFIRGDVNEDGVLTVADIADCTNGPPFSCDDAADVDDNGILNLADCDYLTNWIFGTGPPPPPPFPNCGPDPTADALGCAAFPPCPPGGHGFSGRTMILEYLGMSDSLITEPESTFWHEKYPVYCTTYHLSYWEDDGDGFLSISDQIYLVNMVTGLEIYCHVYEICRDLYLSRKPYETQWHELYPEYCNWYHVDDWLDNDNGVLDSCDWLVLRNKETQEVDTVHVEDKTVTVFLEPVEPGPPPMALEWLWKPVGDGCCQFEDRCCSCPWVYEEGCIQNGGIWFPGFMCINDTCRPPVEDPRVFLSDPVCKNLHEIWPVFSKIYHISSWYDNGNGFLDSCDVIDLTDAETMDTTYWHVIEVATDITVGKPEENYPPEIIQPDTLYGYKVCDTVIYTFDGVDPDGDPILDDASLAIEPPCGTYSVTRLTGHGTPTGTWEVTWITIGCQDSIYYRIIVDLTDDLGNTSWCTTYCHLDRNNPPDIDQPDSLEGYVNDQVQYSITGADPDGDVIVDQASISIVPDCGQYSIARTAGHGTSSGTWQITWQTDGCTACNTYLVIHDLTDGCDTSYCTTKVHLSEMPGWYWKPDYEDYAPSGMPDIDQRQDAWIKFDTEQWSFCGPVAVANCFKWFDSKYNEPNPGVPGDGMDQFPLVRDYLDNLAPLIPPATDDHDPWNVDHIVTPWVAACPPPLTPQPFVPGPQPQPSPMPPWGELVERLACFFNTDGCVTGYCAHTGTNIMEMQAGIDNWFKSETLVVSDPAPDTSTVADSLYERTWPQPTFAWVETLVEKSQDVILLLGFWYEDPPGSGEWWRIGGHYVTVAGVNSDEFMIAFSDPFIDAAEMGIAPGRIRDGSIIPHPHGAHDPTIHNDEGNVSHDIYVVDTMSISPGGVWWLPEYPVFFDPLYWMWNFSNQNVPDEFRPFTRPWNEISPIYTEVEYAIEISPWEYPPDCGDVNRDGVVNVADVIYLISWLFIGGPAPPNRVKADVNHDGLVNISDAVYLLNYLFGGGPPPQCFDP